MHCAFRLKLNESCKQKNMSTVETIQDIASIVERMVMKLRDAP